MTALTAYDVEALRRDEFPWAQAGESIWLNTASTGPLPARTVRTIDEWTRMRIIPSRISQDLQFSNLARGRQLVASLIGAREGEIAMATNTSFGLNLAAFSLPLQPGDIVLSPADEFPANVYPWMQLAVRRGLIHRMIDCEDNVLTVEHLRQEVARDSRVKVVTVSWSQSATGAAVDLVALGAFCREHGIYFVVDAIQGLGPLTVDVHAANIDIMAGGAQKWLLGPWGAGFVYVRQALIPELEPHDVSWLSVKGSDDFSKILDYDLTWRDDARRFEMITLPYQDFAGMVTSLELLHEIGPGTIAGQTGKLTQRIVDWAADRDDIQLVTPELPNQRGGIVVLRPRDAAAMSKALNGANVAHTLRAGTIRLAPYFFNTEAEIDRALAACAR